MPSRVKPKKKGSRKKSRKVPSRRKRKQQQLSISPEVKGFKVVCQDAIKWLAKQGDHSLPNVVVGIPDLEETKFSQSRYITFLRRALFLIFQKVQKKGYCIFMNTDRKYQKTWIDKSYIIQQIAHELLIPLRWHKIILLRPVGSTHIQRPTYQHYLCFSYLGGPGEATPDVMLCGKKSYKNAACPNGTAHAIGFIKRYSPYKGVVDPFVGRGSILAEAKKQGIKMGIGVDISSSQCRVTRKLLGIDGRRSR